jgi:membrane fusion protein (multidrug efflux system)
MRTRPLTILLILLLIAGAGCGRRGDDTEKQAKTDSASEAKEGESKSEKTDEGKKRGGKKGDEEEEQEAVPVEVAEAHIGDISSYLLFNSTLETEGAVEIYAEISGFVRELLVEEGDRVEEGDVLLRLNDEELRVEAREAEVNLTRLESTFKRTQDLSERGMINDQDFESTQFELAQARLSLERAQLRLAYTLVRAPVAGVITDRGVQIGGRVGPSTMLFGMMRLDEMIARVYVPGRYLTSVRKDQVAKLTSDFMPDISFDGWIKRISPVVDPKSGTFKVTVGVTAPADQAPPGLFVSVRIVTDTRQNTVLLPKEAIVYEGGERFIFIVEEDKASKRRLDAGYENASVIEALSDIEPGMPIIVLGQNGLKDGTTIRIVNDSVPTVTDAEGISGEPGDA